MLGRAQSGTRSHLRLLRVLRDEALISDARQAADQLINQDSTLREYPGLAAAVRELKEIEETSFLDKG